MGEDSKDGKEDSDNLSIDPESQVPPSIFFSTDIEASGKPVGSLFMGLDGKLQFEGDMDESAKIFFEMLKPMCDNYIEEKLKKERK